MISVWLWDNYSIDFQLYENQLETIIYNSCIHSNDCTQT